MIKANELRIGNIVDRTDYFCRVVAISEESIELEPINYTSEKFVIQAVKPIPITEESLSLFKITIHELDFSWHEYVVARDHENNSFVYVFGSEENNTGGMFHACKKLTFVHELQNIHFSCTGKELEMNL